KNDRETPRKREAGRRLAHRPESLVPRFAIPFPSAAGGWRSPEAAVAAPTLHPLRHRRSSAVTVPIAVAAAVFAAGHPLAEDCRARSGRRPPVAPAHGRCARVA